MACLSRALGFVLATALFIVTVSCTVDLLAQILPAKYWFLPVCGAAAFDVGFIAWLLTLLHGVRNGEQRSVAWLLLAADFLGVATTSVADVFFYDATKGIVAAFPGDWVRWVVVAVVAVILINVAGWAAMHILHPKHIQAATGLKETPVARITAINETTARRPAPRQLSAPKKRQGMAAQPTKTTEAAPVVEVATDGEEIVDQDGASETEEVEEFADVEEAEATDEDDEDSAPLDEEFDDDEPDETYTVEIQAAPRRSKEAANTSVPLGQRFKNAVQALTAPTDQHGLEENVVAAMDELGTPIKGPKTLKKRR